MNFLILVDLFFFKDGKKIIPNRNLWRNLNPEPSNNETCAYFSDKGNII